MSIAQIPQWSPAPDMTIQGPSPCVCRLLVWSKKELYLRTWETGEAWKVPWWYHMLPHWKLRVGRCISYWKRSFFSWHVSFRGCIYDCTLLTGMLATDRCMLVAKNISGGWNVNMKLIISTWFVMMIRWLQHTGSLPNAMCASQILNMYIDIDYIDTYIHTYIHTYIDYMCIYTDYIYIYTLYMYVIYYLWSVIAGRLENTAVQHLKDWNASSPNWGDANQIGLGWWFFSSNWLGLLLPWELTYPPF